MLYSIFCDKLQYDWHNSVTKTIMLESILFVYNDCGIRSKILSKVFTEDNHFIHIKS
jgi:hypothetical protein